MFTIGNNKEAMSRGTIFITDEDHKYVPDEIMPWEKLVLDIDRHWC